ncbi:hypothetical protein HanXRQr2_Chr15g0671001 [Helianthus annuus]|uniref:Uncharacterized protein n=1 Tax=Helianthus annuus TaxID=4232 RepID=A0A9K3H2R9_HELAN|nr:hypothetical protein HanXRQr2_Chr15g0671001 [Helianthus annuus]
MIVITRMKNNWDTKNHKFLIFFLWNLHKFVITRMKNNLKKNNWDTKNHKFLIFFLWNLHKFVITSDNIK